MITNEIKYTGLESYAHNIVSSLFWNVWYECRCLMIHLDYLVIREIRILVFLFWGSLIVSYGTLYSTLCA